MELVLRDPSLEKGKGCNVVKILFRRAAAYRALKDFENAVQDLQHAIQIEEDDPSSCASSTLQQLRRELKEVKCCRSKAKEQEKKVYKGLFQQLKKGWPLLPYFYVFMKF